MMNLLNVSSKLLNLKTKKENKKVPIAKYDDATGKAYLEYPDGRKEYA